jgi:hypothetical protein
MMTERGVRGVWRSAAESEAYLVKRWKQARNMNRPTPERNTRHERRFTFHGFRFSAGQFWRDGQGSTA